MATKGTGKTAASKASTKEVIESTPGETLPISGRRPDPIAKVSVTLEEDDNHKRFALYFTYLLYKCNLLARNNIKEVVREMNKELPECGVAKYLVNEASKM